MISRHAILALAATIGVIILIGTLEWSRHPISTAAPSTMPSGRPPVLGVAAAVRTLKLVTWQFDASISADSVSDKWYGTAVANVRAPVRYQYGVDLSQLRREDVLFDTDAGAYVFLVPSPERISVEVDLAKLEQTLEVSGARWTGQNQGELDAARTKLAALAQAMDLSPEDAKRLRDVSREQLEKHLAGVIGTTGLPAQVSVRFVD